MARRVARSDAGMTLMEVVVAMSVFTVLAATSVGILIRTTGVARDNVARTQAINLATKAIEAARSMAATDIPDGKTVSTAAVDGQTYTITQTASYVPTDASSSVCTSSGNTLAYKLVTVRVTWPNMSPGINPVREDTLRAVGVGSSGLDSSLGTLAVLVAGVYGTATDGITVTLSPDNVTEVTGSDGCAVFTGLTPGTLYTVNASIGGYTGSGNTQSASTSSVTVAAASVTRATLLYDTQRRMVVGFDSPAGAVIPSTLPLRFADSFVSETTYTTCPANPVAGCVTAVPGTARVLYPAIYTVKIGTCTEASPSQNTIDLRAASASGSSVTVPVAAPKIVVKTVLGAAVVGRTITASHAAAAGCTSGESYTTPSVSGGGNLVLPYGTWVISVRDNTTGLTVPSTTVLSGTNKTPTVTLTVTS